MGTVAVGVAALSPVALAQPAAALATAPASTLRRSTFTPLLGASFKMAHGRVTVPVTLTSIADLPEAPAGDQGRFSLRFLAAGRLPLPQDSYSFTNAKLSVTLFVVPVGPPSTSQPYLAVINTGSWAEPVS
jgi:hypothetical protein